MFWLFILLAVTSSDVVPFVSCFPIVAVLKSLKEGRTPIRFLMKKVNGCCFLVVRRWKKTTGSFEMTGVVSDH